MFIPISIIIILIFLIIRGYFHREAERRVMEKMANKISELEEKMEEKEIDNTHYDFEDWTEQ